MQRAICKLTVTFAADSCDSIDTNVRIKEQQCVDAANKLPPGHWYDTAITNNCHCLMRLQFQSH